MRRNKPSESVGYAQPNGIATITNGRNLAFGFPDKLVAKLRYNEFVSVTSTTGGIGKYLFRMNSLFDPNFTGTGHQPLYYDTYGGIYDHYSVVNAKLTVKFVNSSTVPFRVGCVIDDDSTSSTTIETLCEQSHGRHTILPAQGGSLSSHTFTVPWSCKQILGIDPYETQSYKTAIGSNPSEESYVVIWAASGDGTTATLYIDVSIEFESLFSELTTPIQS